MAKMFLTISISLIDISFIKIILGMFSCVLRNARVSEVARNCESVLKTAKMDGLFGSRKQMNDFRKQMDLSNFVYYFIINDDHRKIC